MLTDVKCNHCGRPMKYEERYTTIDFTSMSYMDIEEFETRIAQFCKKCSALVLLFVRRHIKT